MSQIVLEMGKNGFFYRCIVPKMVTSKTVSTQKPTKRKSRRHRIRKYRQNPNHARNRLKDHA